MSNQSLRVRKEECWKPARSGHRGTAAVSWKHASLCHKGKPSQAGGAACHRPMRGRPRRRREKSLSLERGEGSGKNGDEMREEMGPLMSQALRIRIPRSSGQQQDTPDGRAEKSLSR